MVRRQSWLTAAHTCSNFEGVVAVLGWPDQSSLAVEVLPFLKRPNHSKVRLWLMHESPKPVSTFQKFHFPFYPISHITWCIPFVRQLLPYRRYQKIADGWCHTHIKTRATIKRFHIQPRHSAHSHTRHHRNTPWRETRKLQATCVLWVLSWNFWIHLHTIAFLVIQETISSEMITVCQETSEC